MLYLFAYSSNEFEWMKLSDARLILFHTSLHYIDTAAELRLRSKFEFLHLKHLHQSFVLQHAFNLGNGTGRGYT